MSTAIKVENLSKAYQLGDFSTGTITQDLERFFDRIRGKEDRFLKIGETNDRTTTSDSNMVWSLKDINFEINQGDAVGIIGRNGAGKSTLLKILSRITSPTTGSVKIKGRVASLLEVGTGFHPELTGRENIFLNGAILGMRKAEIKRKFEEIVEFSGVQRYIDTPVKRYSSGMYVRLAFAVAAHLESEILIVDEVLAVGDAEFQKKCLGKMNDVSKGEGRTVLFVSHNMGAIQQLCNNCVLLRNGRLVSYGVNEKIIADYIFEETHIIYQKDFNENNEVEIINGFLNSESIIQSDKIKISLTIKSIKKCKVSLDIRFQSNMAVPIAFGSVGTFNYDEKINLEIGENNLILEIDVKSLALGNYNLSIDVTEPNVKFYDRCENCLGFEIVRNDENDRRMSQSWGYGSYNIPVKIL